MTEESYRYLIRPKRHPFSDWAFPLWAPSLSRGKKARKMLRQFFGERHCLETKLAMLPVSTDMYDGSELVINDAPMWQVVLASGSIPGFVPLVEYGGRRLGDGVLINNVPASVLKEYGTDFVISINISIDPEDSTYNPGSMFSNMIRALDILLDHGQQDFIQFTDFEIKPNINGFGILDYGKGQQIIEAGRQEMEKRLPELKRRLKRADIVI